MDIMEFEKRLNKFKHNSLEWYKGNPQISDEEWDKEYEFFKKNLETFDIKLWVMMNIGQGEKVERKCHFPEIVKSQDPSWDYKYLKQFATYGIVPKYDGSNIVAFYENGKCYKIVSSGHSDIGTNQTPKLIKKVHDNVDSSIKEIYYEAVVDLNTGKDRSNANGLINSKYLQKDVDEYLVLKCVGCYADDQRVQSHFIHENVETIEYLSEKYGIYSADGYFKFGMEKGYLSDNDGRKIPIDGFVAFNEKENKSTVRKIYYTKSAITKIADYELTFSDKTGTYSAVVILEPVKLGKTNVRKVKPGPIGKMYNEGLGIGAEVEVVLSGGVIPKINKVINKSFNLDKLRVCPSCGHPMKQIGQDYYCPNMDCENNINWILMRLSQQAEGSDSIPFFENVLRIPRFDYKKIQNTEYNSNDLETFEKYKDFMLNKSNMLSGLMKGLFIHACNVYQYIIDNRLF